MKKTGVSSVPETKRKENIKKQGMANSIKFIPTGEDRPSSSGCFWGTTLALVLPFYFPLAAAHFMNLVLQSSP